MEFYWFIIYMLIYCWKSFVDNFFVDKSIVDVNFKKFQFLTNKCKIEILYCILIENFNRLLIFSSKLTYIKS